MAFLDEKHIDQLVKEAFVRHQVNGLISEAQRLSDLLNEVVPQARAGQDLRRKTKGQKRAPVPGLPGAEPVYKFTQGEEEIETDTAPSAEGTEVKHSFWDGVKHWLSKAGSLEKGGKVFSGRSKRVQAAKEQFGAALTKASNSTIKSLFDEINKEFPEFPNMKDKWQFRNGVAAIAQTYDSLVAATKLYKPGQEQQPKGALSPVIANELIGLLRMYVNKLLDYDLSDVYKHFTENTKIYDDGELEWLFELSAKEMEAIADAPEDEASTPEGPLSSKYGDSETMKGLRSNRLPLILGLVGSAGIGAYVTGAATSADISAGAKVDPQTGKGVQQLVDTRFEMTASPRGTLNNFAAAAKEFGGSGDYKDLAGNVEILAKQANVSPEDFMAQYGSQARLGEASEQWFKAVYDWQANEGGTTAAWNVSGKLDPKFSEFINSNPEYAQAAEVVQGKGMVAPGPDGSLPASQGMGTGRKGISDLMALDSGQKIVIVGKVAKALVTGLALRGAAGAAGGAAAKAVGMGANPLVGALGIGLVASGAAVALLRAKGRWKSRAKELDVLAQALKDVPVPKEEKTIVDPIVPPPTPVTPPVSEGAVPIYYVVKLDDDGDLKVHPLPKTVSRSYQGSKQKQEEMKQVAQAVQNQIVMGDDRLEAVEDRADEKAQEGEPSEPEAEEPIDDRDLASIFESWGHDIDDEYSAFQNLNEDEELDEQERQYSDEFEGKYNRIRKSVSQINKRIRRQMKKPLKSGKTRSPEIYYVFDQSVENGLPAGTDINKFRGMLKKVLNKLKEKSDQTKQIQPLTAEEIKEALGGRTRVKGYKLGVALAMLQKHGATTASKKAVKQALKKAKTKASTDTSTDSSGGTSTSEMSPEERAAAAIAKAEKKPTKKLPKRKKKVGGFLSGPERDIAKKAVAESKQKDRWKKIAGLK